MPRKLEVPSLWRPLRTPIFRRLLAADVASDVGAFMQSVGAAWLMVSLGAGPMYVALVQTAATLPVFLFVLPAGAIGDIVDRRKLILFTEAWMVCAAVVLAAVTLTGVITPWLLLVLTFALSAGDAFETPTWRAILPELVTKEDLPAASALNAIEFNIARAVGPALAGILIATAGVGTAFMVNVASFCGVILVVARWKRPVRKRSTPPETVRGATVAAIRYVRYAPTIRGLMLRAGAGMFFAGALVMQAARGRWSNEAVASTAVAALGVTIIATGLVHALGGLVAVMLVSGGSWLIFISLLTALVQTMAPDWVRARVLATFMLVFQGGLAAGSAVWGSVGARAGVETALLWAGLGTIATTALGLVARLPDTADNVDPWNHWRMPAVVEDVAPGLEQGPVLVTVEYLVDPQHAKEFMRAIHKYERVRRRDGASRWGIYRDVEHPEVYLETFLVTSWAEHLRQHDRVTRGDGDLEDRLHSYVRGQPRVRHLVYVEAES